MRRILFGATGMVGQGLLREALADASVTKVLTVGRFPRHVTTTRKVGRAMLQVAKEGAAQQVLENDAVNRLAGEA